jgi:hypothetical protein
VAALRAADGTWAESVMRAHVLAAKAVLLRAARDQAPAGDRDDTGGQDDTDGTDGTDGRDDATETRIR